MGQENKFRCFLSLAETCSFTVTAKMLFLTQQAVSKNIRNLEEELGFPLFIRSSRSVELTEQGRQCYELLSKLANQYSVGMASIRKSANLSAHTLRLGLQSFLNFGTALETALAGLREQVSDLQTETTRFSPLMLLERLRERRLDLILVYRRFLTDTRGLRSLELTTSPRCLMVSLNDPLLRPGADWQQFKAYPLISDSVRGESSEDFQTRIQADIQALGLCPSEIIWVPDRDTAYTYAEMGRGVVVGTEMSRMAQARNLASFPMQAHEVLLAVWRKGERNPLVEQYARQVCQTYQAGTL